MIVVVLVLYSVQNCTLNAHSVTDLLKEEEEKNRFFRQIEH
jgi:hypothetical protein